MGRKKKLNDEVVLVGETSDAIVVSSEESSDLTELVLDKVEELAESVETLAETLGEQDEEYEVLEPTTPEPLKSVWVTDPAKIKKVLGYRDTLHGTEYLGEPK